MNMLVS